MTPSKISKLIDLFKLKLKFALSSSLATAVDYGMYLFLVAGWFSPVVSNVLSAGTGMLINFIMQKSYVFEMNRTLKETFVISLLTSIVGIGLGTMAIYLLNKNIFFAEHQPLTKALVVGTVFFYNFYMKRFAFEKRFL